ncbi:unnamed protein product [Cylicocyclus nassatus]|uniref:Uncharacterized protein n=1 Tax=Cylicocyclus nassatus TaxID=53992 RepID=A0AA36GC91_CYLNA|nr:unnamed protein product [Cylicocyclus nassatus]
MNKWSALHMRVVRKRIPSFDLVLTTSELLQLLLLILLQVFANSFSVSHNSKPQMDFIGTCVIVWKPICASQLHSLRNCYSCDCFEGDTDFPSTGDDLLLREHEIRIRLYQHLRGIETMPFKQVIINVHTLSSLELGGC